MMRKALMIGAVLAFSILASAHPVHAQCSPLTLTANGSSRVTVSPGSHVMFAGMLSNCGTAAANVSLTVTITSNGSTVSTDADTFALAAGENRPISVGFEGPKTAGTYVATATSSNGGSATATVTVQ